MRSHFTATLSLSVLGIILLAAMIWGGFFWRERLRVRAALLVLLLMSILGSPFNYFYKGNTTIFSLFYECVLFPLLLCVFVYRGRRFLVPDILKLTLAVIIFFSIRIPIFRGDDYSVMWQIGRGTSWESALSFLPLGILTGNVVTKGLASNLYYGIVALSALSLYGLLCYVIAAVVTALLKKPKGA